MAMWTKAANRQMKQIYCGNQENREANYVILIFKRAEAVKREKSLFILRRKVIRISCRKCLSKRHGVGVLNQVIYLHLVIAVV
jgi:hypothetical protein